MYISTKRFIKNILCTIQRLVNLLIINRFIFFVYHTTLAVLFFCFNN